jgi:hypothetical protein
MSPTIRIDDEVYSWLQKQARPFEDTPNSVLRRIAGFHDYKDEVSKLPKEPLTDIRIPIPENKNRKIARNIPPRMTKGEILNRKWNVGAQHALYHKDGHWYNNLQFFPGALFDPDGYIMFNSEDEYTKSPYLRIGKETNVPNTISSIPGYIRKT